MHCAMHCNAFLEKCIILGADSLPAMHLKCILSFFFVLLLDLIPLFQSTVTELCYAAEKRKEKPNPEEKNASTSGFAMHLKCIAMHFIFFPVYHLWQASAFLPRRSTLSAAQKARSQSPRQLPATHHDQR